MNNNTNNSSNKYTGCMLIGAIHNHSVFSRFDSEAEIKAIFEKAARLNPNAMIAITDHGNLMAVTDAFQICKEVNAELGTNIKYVPGVEFYVEEDDAVTGRSHLIMLATDEIGYKTMSRAVTRSNERLDSQGFPRINEEMLVGLFGPETLAHGHVIVTSACMIGAVNNILLKTEKINKEIMKTKNKQSGLFNPTSKVYLENKEKVASFEERIIEIREEVKALDKISKKSFVKREKTVSAAIGKPEYDELLAELNKDKKESEDAANRVVELKTERVNIQKQMKTIKEHLKEEEKDHAKWEALQQKIDDLSKYLVSDEVLREEARNELIKYRNMFGKENFFVELQYHRIPEEAKVMPIIAELAKELNIPVVAANDAHMVNNDAESIKRRQIIRSLRYNQWENVDDSDKELYLKDDNELSSILLEILPENVVSEAMVNIGKILERCNVSFEYQEHYPKFKSPINGESSYDYLVRIANDGIQWRYPNGEGWTEEHQKRMEYELDVIQKLNVCDYLAIVEDFLRYGRLLGRIDLNNPEYLKDPYNIENLEKLADGKVGLGIGPGRGSAVGSLVCYLIGITGIDPMKYNLIFERFLNTERVTMPDIDSDFKPDIRTKVLDYVKYKYGKHAVCCIMTKGTQQAKAAIRNCARLLGDEKFGDTTRFLSLGDEICKAVPKELNIKLDDCWDDLVEKFKENKDALEILNNAKLVEGTFLNIGMHAAGVIISDNGDVGEYVPLMYNKAKEQWTTQCDKEQCEPLGLLKMDFLGLRNLGIITETLKNVEAKTGKKIDIERAPLEKEVFEKIFSAGLTNSVFQFESSGMKQMLRQFKPSSIDDIILLVAAYRPGPMQFLDDIIAVKHGTKKPQYVIPEMEEVLGNTYGYPVYQEQIMQIFNRFAGFSLGESDIIRRYMSKKKTEKFMAYKDKFVEGMVARGGEKSKVEEFWNQLLDFSRYAFNKSHAAAYAFVAYYTAFLKYHYPTEYLCAVMNDTVFDKVGNLINDCRDFNINVKPVNINSSVNDFSISGNDIVFGFSKLKGVGDGATEIIEERDKNGKFKSFGDFMTRVNPKKNVVEALIKAGAFDEYSASRSALLNAVPEYSEYLKKISAKKSVIAENEADNPKAIRAQAALETLYENLKSIAINVDGDENKLERLLAEKEISGAFISGHPLDVYKRPEEIGCTSIENLSVGNRKIAGIVSNLRIQSRKSDGALMAFFTLEDKTGSVDVCCFTKAFDEFGSLIKENAVLKLTGKVTSEVAFNASSDEGDDELVFKFNLNNVETLTEEKMSIVLNVPNLVVWTEEIYNKVKPYQIKDGYSLILYDELTGMFRKTSMIISREILNNKIGLKTFIN